MTHRTLILVIHRLSERARRADDALNMFRPHHDSYRHNWDIRTKCRAKIDQLTERYS